MAWIAPITFYLGREHAQREYKLGGPANLKGYEAFDFWNWKKDPLLDLIMPIIFSSLGLVTVLFIL